MEKKSGCLRKRGELCLPVSLYYRHKKRFCRSLKCLIKRINHNFPKWNVSLITKPSQPEAIVIIGFHIQKVYHTAKMAPAFPLCVFLTTLTFSTTRGQCCPSFLPEKRRLWPDCVSPYLPSSLCPVLNVKESFNHHHQQKVIDQTWGGWVLRDTVKT